MVEQLLSTMRAVALPMKTNFRGVTTREVALFEGDFGWVEFSPRGSELRQGLGATAAR